MSAELGRLCLGVIKLVHSADGWVFGAAVRTMFLASPEPLSELDVIFTRENLPFFIRVLNVDHRVEIIKSNSSSSTCTDANVKEYWVNHAMLMPNQRIRLRIHSFHSGLTGDCKLPISTMHQPTFDIDFVFWKRNALVFRPPKGTQTCEGGIEPPSMLGRAIDLIMDRKFSVVNPLVLACPDAMATMIKRARLLVNLGFTQVHNHAMPHTPVIEATTTTENNFCPINQDQIDETVRCRLACNHVFSIKGISGWINSKDGSGGSQQGCPLCKQAIVDNGLFFSGLLPS